MPTVQLTEFMTTHRCIPNTPIIVKKKKMKKKKRKEKRQWHNGRYDGRPSSVRETGPIAIAFPRQARTLVQLLCGCITVRSCTRTMQTVRSISRLLHQLKVRCQPNVLYYASITAFFCFCIIGIANHSYESDDDAVDLNSDYFIDWQPNVSFRYQWIEFPITVAFFN